MKTKSESSSSAPHHDWPDLELFDLGLTTTAGSHRIDFHNSEPVELVMNEYIANNKNPSIVIFFDHLSDQMIETQLNKMTSSVSRRSLTLPVISIADPMLSLDPSRETGWFTGKPGGNYIHNLIMTLKSIQRITGKELIFTGSYSGGFAALEYGRLFKGPSSVITWNAITDMFYSAEAPLKHLLRKDYNLAKASIARPDWRAYGKVRTDKLINTSVSDSETIYSPRRQLFICDASEWMLKRHVGPFLASINLSVSKPGVTKIDKNHFILVENFNRHEIDSFPEIFKIAIYNMATSDSDLDNFRELNLH